jgi:predicted DNA-binding protein (UPF0251 family)
MSRPKKRRKVSFIPANKLFYPIKNNTEYTVINFEELEAVRLSDYEGFDQSLAAEKMNVSRGTFQRIINCARKKISDSLINGKLIKIDGGNYEHIMNVEMDEEVLNMKKTRTLS